MRSCSCFSAIFFVTFFCASLILPVQSWGANIRHSPGSSAAKQTVVVTGSRTSSSETVIPGPLRSFERMAAISQEVPPGDVLPLFALNVFAHGYGRRRDDERGGRPTEYLLLVERYLQQARKLQELAGPQGILRVSGCGQAKPLLDILGYRLGQPCGPKAFLATADPDRAFLTIDSGFPLARLEQTLRSGKPFVYPYASTRVPLLFSADDWTSNAKDAHFPKDDVIDCLARDPILARLYWALSQLDSETRNDLKESVGIQKLLPDAPVLDFYGREICIRSGRVLVPGGPGAESAWSGLVGATPEKPAQFVSLLLRKDNGWLAAYYDALARINRSRQTYFTGPARLKTFYQALRNGNPHPGPARPVFRTDAGLVLLVSQLQLDRNGQPHVPGNLQVWKNALPSIQTDSHMIRKAARRAGKWKRPEDLLAAMFAFSRAETDDGPLQMYLLLSAIDRDRSSGERLQPRTARLLIDNFARLHDQYLLFSEFPGLRNAAIDLFLYEAENLDRIRSSELRANAIGMFQAEIGLWHILARQGEIPDARLSRSFEKVIRPFAAIGTPSQLFGAGRSSFAELCRAAAGRTGLSEDEFIALLAGPPPASPQAAQVRQEIADRIRAVMGNQRLVSLDTLFTLGNGLDALAHGKGEAGGLIPLTAQLHQFEMPQPIFSARQMANWSYGLADNRHTAAQEHVDLRKVLEDAHSPQQLLDARGQLCPFLRDSLVGIDYAYYEPPGAELERNDPFFVRSHDFSGAISSGGGQSWQTPFLVGRGWTAGGGAHLSGSLADLSYVLASVEQNFIVPRNVQALIWSDMVPTLLTDAVVPRWWGISRNELHAVALYQRAGEELLAASARNRQLRSRVMDILSDRMLPARQERVENALRAGRVRDALAEATPADTFYLTARFRREFPAEAADCGPACRELEALSQSDPSAVSLARLSRDFGVPHPTLAYTNSLQLLSMKPMPTFMGYSSRLLAESWDSDNLYWARLADRAGYAPVMLNILVPEFTRAMVANIFASYPGDWPALLRALRQTGEEFRRGQIASLPKPAFVSAAPSVTAQP
ncbi:MAG TPA: hypothetical protein VNJ12_13940 [Candidatus Dormibacteraeota bacterium]|nr:hypothetical protein [Candidatus Dormibacteraeota bacterium]